MLKEAKKDDRVTVFLHHYANAMAAGTAEGRDFMCAARLTALSKGNGKVRPIAIGELFYRLLATTVLREAQSVTDVLPNQLGNGTPGGVEPIIRRLEQVCWPRAEHEEHHWELDTNCFLGLNLKAISDPESRAAPAAAASADARDANPEARRPAGPTPIAVGSFDVSNAFNELRRSAMATAIRTHKPNLWRLARWAYGTHSKLFLATTEGMRIIWSQQGVRQGNPFGG